MKALAFSRTWGWLGTLIMWFLVFVIFFWIVYYSLKPAWTVGPDGVIDTARVLLAAVGTAALAIFVVWIALALSARH